MERILQSLGHDKLSLRVGYAYLCFFVLLALAYAFGLLFLPEGVMRTLPLPSLTFFEGKQLFSSLVVRTVGYNLFALLLIVGMNHFRVRRFTLGYLPLYANTLLMGLFAGTNSFSGGISTYTFEGWMMFFRIGFLEFSAYILVCAATVGLAMFHADRWRGEQFKRIRRLSDVRLSTQELVVVLIALGMLIVAAFNEWKCVG
jgi:hypothetical protein